MARIASTIRSRLNFFSRKRQFQHKPIQNEDAEDTEDFRTRGSEILKAITTAPESTPTRSPTARVCNEHDSTCINSSGKIEKDLHDVDNKVTNHQDEHKRLQDIKESTDSNGNEWQNRVKRLKHLKRTIELARRKKFDNRGSFAINMVTYRDHKNKTCPNVNGKGYEEKGSIASSIRSSGHDDRSRSSESTCITNDFTLQVIDEEIAYNNTK